MAGAVFCNPTLPSCRDSAMPVENKARQLANQNDTDGRVPMNPCLPVVTGPSAFAIWGRRQTLLPALKCWSKRCTRSSLSSPSLVAELLRA
jgi:hypothetical protein